MMIDQRSQQKKKKKEEASLSDILSGLLELETSLLSWHISIQKDLRLQFIFYY